jgi:hypothetical protein
MTKNQLVENHAIEIASIQDEWSKTKATVKHQAKELLKAATKIAEGKRESNKLKQDFLDFRINADDAMNAMKFEAAKYRRMHNVIEIQIYKHNNASFFKKLFWKFNV